MAIDFMWGYNKKPEFKTFVPDSWSYELFRDKIQESLMFPKEIRDSTALHVSMTGKTKDGIELSVCFRRKTEQDPWLIATAFVDKEFILKN